MSDDETFPLEVRMAMQWTEKSKWRCARILMEGDVCKYMYISHTKWVKFPLSSNMEQTRILPFKLQLAENEYSLFVRQCIKDPNRIYIREEEIMGLYRKSLVIPTEESKQYFTLALGSVHMYYKYGQDLKTIALHAPEHPGGGSGYIPGNTEQLEEGFQPLFAFE